MPRIHCDTVVTIIFPKELKRTVIIPGVGIVVVVPPPIMIDDGS